MRLHNARTNGRRKANRLSRPGSKILAKLKASFLSGVNCEVPIYLPTGANQMVEFSPYLLRAKTTRRVGVRKERPLLALRRGKTLQTQPRASTQSPRARLGMSSVSLAGWVEGRHDPEEGMGQKADQFNGRSLLGLRAATRCGSSLVSRTCCLPARPGDPSSFESAPAPFG